MEENENALANAMALDRNGAISSAGLRPATEIGNDATSGAAPLADMSCQMRKRRETAARLSH
jgi:hypothetical protein